MDLKTHIEKLVKEGASVTLTAKPKEIASIYPYNIAIRTREGWVSAGSDDLSDAFTGALVQLFKYDLPSGVPEDKGSPMSVNYFVNKLSELRFHVGEHVEQNKDTEKIFDLLNEMEGIASKAWKEYYRGRDGGS